MVDFNIPGESSGIISAGKGTGIENVLSPVLLGDVDANKPAPLANNAFSKPEPKAPVKRAPRKATGAAAVVRAAVTRGRGKAAAAAEEQAAE